VLNYISTHKNLQRKHQPGERERERERSVIQYDQIQNMYFTFTVEFEFEDFFLDGFDFILQDSLLKNEVLDFRLLRERRATIEQKITVL
jgi:hypothetical protein